MVCFTSIFASTGAVTEVLSLLFVEGEDGELVGGVCIGVPLFVARHIASFLLNLERESGKSSAKELIAFCLMSVFRSLKLDKPYFLHRVA